MKEITKAFKSRAAPARDNTESAFYDGMQAMHDAYINIAKGGDNAMGALMLVGKMADELKHRDK